MIKVSLHHRQGYSEQKRPLSRRFSIKLKNVRPTFFQNYPKASRFNLIVHLCPSMVPLTLLYFIMLFYCFKWLLQCFTLRFEHFGYHQDSMKVILSWYCIILRDIAPLSSCFQYCQLSLRRTPSGPASAVRLREVSGL